MLATNKRVCAECGETIINCMGMVNAGDWLAQKDVIRELCGKCVFKHDVKDNLWAKDLTNIKKS